MLLRIENGARTSPPALRIETIGGLESLANLKADWDKLVTTAAIEYPFLTHEWTRLWWECFGAHRTLHIIVVREGSEVVGIAPMLMDTERLFGLNLRTLALIWNSHVPRCDFIVKEQRADIYQAIWNQIAAERRDWDLLLLPQVPKGSPILSELGEFAAESGFLVATRVSGALPYVAISGTWQSYFESLPWPHRSNISSRTERLSNLGALERERVTGGCSTFARDFDEAAQIQAAGQRVMIADPSADEHGWTFYSKLAGTPGLQDSVRLHYLRSGGKRIAFDLSLRYDNIMYLIRGGFLPEFARYSPLNVLASINLQQCFHEGIRRYDFVTSDEDWARYWRCSALSHHWMFIYANNPRTALFHAMKFSLAPLIEEWTRNHEMPAAA